MVVERSQQLQPGQHAVNPVVVPPQRLRIHVRTGHDRGKLRIFPRTTDKHIAHAVDVTGKTGVQRPVAQQMTRNAIFLAQCQTGDATGGRAADLRHHLKR